MRSSQISDHPSDSKLFRPPTQASHHTIAPTAQAALAAIAIFQRIGSAFKRSQSLATGT
jgi:hypothetical protein